MINKNVLMQVGILTFSCKHCPTMDACKEFVSTILTYYSLRSNKIEQIQLS